jgi:hypothetical protein
MRVIGVPPRGIGEKTLLALQNTQLSAMGVSLGNLCLTLADWGGFDVLHRNGGRSASILADFGGMLQIGEYPRQISIVDLIDRFYQ